MWVNEGTPTVSFVLYTINVECMCDANYVTWKYRQYRRYHVIFARKYKSLQNVNILGARFNSSGTPFFAQIKTHALVQRGIIVNNDTDIIYTHSCLTLDAYSQNHS